MRPMSTLYEAAVAYVDAYRSGTTEEIGVAAAELHAVVTGEVVKEREACAAYCLDRADQYETKSPIWVGIANCAEGIAKGEAAESFRAGETEDLLKRVRQLAGFSRTTPKPREKKTSKTWGDAHER